MEIKEYCIDCSKLNDKDVAHDHLKEVLELPDHYGRNLDALHDCLCEHPQFIIKLENVDALGEYGKKVLTVITDAAQENGSRIRIGHSEHIGKITPEELEKFIRTSAEVKRLEKLIEGTELKDRIDYVRDLYRELEVREDKFCETFDVSCKKDCCQCCMNFTPDILEAEADYMAFGIIAEGRADEVLELIENSDPNIGRCLMLHPEDKAHPCAEYQWRPLLCRLFGDAASKNKDGHPTFRRCKWNEAGHDVSTEDMEKRPDSLVVMSDYGMRMEDIDVDSNGTLMLGEALKKSIEKVRYIISLKEEAAK